MARNVTQYDLLVSCPSDVKEELEIIKETVDSFNRMFGAANNVSIVAKHWSTDSFPESGGRPQELLNEQFVFGCDAAIAVFWTRFGTPTDQYGSGTEEEIEKLIQSGKQVFLYFSDCAVNPSQIDNNQYQKILSFRDKYKDKGVYGTYSNINDFKKDFLNHLSLYFVRLLTDKDSTITTKSKMSISGVVNGKVSEQPKLFIKNYSNSQFIQGLKDIIREKFEDIKRIVLPVKLVETNENTKNEIVAINNKLNPELNRKFGELALMFKDQLKGINNIFPSSKVELSNEFKHEIRKYSMEQNINMHDELDFFYFGELTKQQQPFGGGPLGTNPSINISGSDDEKRKYELLKQLKWKINEYQQYINYFSAIDSKYYLELALSNFGSRYDEDVDVKLYLKKGCICDSTKLPIPEASIVVEANRYIGSIFKPKKTSSVTEYSDYQIIPPSLKHYNISYADEVENEKKNYKQLLGNIFCYDYFQDDHHDILTFNLNYIKQNTSIYFPSVLVFNSQPNLIRYEILSKHYPDIIKGELQIISAEREW